MSETQARIEMFDTTLRDGCQGTQVKFSVDEMLAITQKLADLGFDFVEAGFPYSSDRDREYYRRVKQLTLGRTQVVAFGMVRHKDARPEEDHSLLSLLEADIPVVSLVGLASADQVKTMLGVEPDVHLEMIEESIRFLKGEGVQVFFNARSFFDGLRLNEAYTLLALQRACAAGADCLVLCDTTGGSLPDQVGAAVAMVRRTLPDARLAIHAHNDGGLAVANSLIAVANGATQVQGTINGLGERCGNVDLINVVATLGLKLGYEVLREGATKRLTELSRFVYDQGNLNYSETQPFVGNAAFAHTGGVCFAALRKDPAQYEHVLAEAVGNRRRVLVSDLSGRASLVEKLVSFGLRCEGEELLRLHNEVVRLEDLGWQFEAADATLHLLALRLMGKHRPWFVTQHYNVLVRGVGPDLSQVAGKEDEVEAAVKIKVGGRLEHSVSEGTGPVNALDLALRKALRPNFPEIDQMKLTEYSVRVIGSLSEPTDGEPLAGTGSTARRVRVKIQSQDNDGNVWGTVAVTRNILSASWAALVDAFEYKRLLDLKKVWGEISPGSTFQR